LWYFSYRNTPEEHTWTSRAELEFVRGTDEKGNVKQIDFKKKPTVPWRVLLSSPNMWAIMCGYFTYVYCLWIFLSWLPSYLVEYRHFTLIKMGYYASMPLFAGVIGDTVGGWATDYLLIKTGKTKFSRRIVAIVGLLGCVVFIVPAAIAQNASTAVYCLTAALFFLECTIGPSWAVPMDVGGEYSGTVSGMMNMAGNLGGALSPTVFGILVQLGSWIAPFIVAAGLLVFGAIVWAFWLNPEVSVLDKKKLIGNPITSGTIT
jgi:sugar phosphate permease